jgi:predicted TPR repeat methyltransferase
VRLSDGLTCGYVAKTLEAMRYNAATGPALDIELPINERHALKSAATRLQIAFADTFDTETVERLVYSSYEKLAAEVRLIRDEIERRVRRLLDDLRIPYRS